jgi:glycosyltransferase involved in cell wall biosynthesis
MGTRVGQDYLIRTLADELQVLDASVSAPRWPHVEAALNAAPMRAVLREVQNLCWTVARWRRRVGRRAPAFQLPERRGAPRPAGSRILLDITRTIRTGRTTGIERVCLRLAEEGHRSGHAEAVKLDRGEIVAVESGEAIAPGPGDVYVILDTFWDPLAEYLAAAVAVRRAGGRVALCVHDMVPLICPAVVAPRFPAVFAAAFDALLPYVDVVAGVSASTLADFNTVVAGRRSGGDRPGFAFGLGADRPPAPSPDDVALPPEATRHPFFLSVGTLEPKKGYAITLDAFDALWREDRAVNLVIIGGYGWGARAIRRRILAHPRLGKNLFWIRGASDALLASAYRRCQALVQASVAEGFGIPILEAATHGRPIIASDIDVFREIGGDRLSYFSSGDAGSLATSVRAMLATPRVTDDWQAPTWSDSLTRLCAGLRAIA